MVGGAERVWRVLGRCMAGVGHDGVGVITLCFSLTIIFPFGGAFRQLGLATVASLATLSRIS